MIELIKASKYYPTQFGPHYVFRDVSLVLPDDKNVGVIGPNGAGKTTLLRLLAGADIPTSGRIERTGRVSWPMGLTAGLQRTLTGRENARFLCRVYGMPTHKIKAQLEKINEISQIGKFFDMPASTYSAGMIQRLSFAISISLGFDYYIFDEISAGGDLAFGGLSQGMMQDRLRASRFIVATHNLPEVLKLCSAVIVIGGGALTYYDTAKAGVDAYRESVKKTAKSGPPVDPAVLARQRERYISLSQAEQRLAAAVVASRDETKAAELRRRLQNTRLLLQDVAMQLRLNNVAVPSAAEIARAGAVPELQAADPAMVRRLVQLRRQIEDLKSTEARQELNAEKAETKAKRGDFLARLEVTRQSLAERNAELASLEEEISKAEAAPPKPQAPPRKAAPSPGGTAIPPSPIPPTPGRDKHPPQ
jgi:capsular polysaccharide transport system ATP-binding protein